MRELAPRSALSRGVAASVGLGLFVACWLGCVRDPSAFASEGAARDPFDLWLASVDVARTQPTALETPIPALAIHELVRGLVDPSERVRAVSRNVLWSRIEQALPAVAAELRAQSEGPLDHSGELVANFSGWRFDSNRPAEIEAAALQDREHDALFERVRHIDQPPGAAVPSLGDLVTSDDPRAGWIGARLSVQWGGDARCLPGVLRRVLGEAVEAQRTRFIHRLEVSVLTFASSRDLDLRRLSTSAFISAAQAFEADWIVVAIGMRGESRAALRQLAAWAQCPSKVLQQHFVDDDVQGFGLCDALRAPEWRKSLKALLTAARAGSAAREFAPAVAAATHDPRTAVRLLARAALLALDARNEPFRWSRRP